MVNLNSDWRLVCATIRGKPSEINPIDKCIIPKTYAKKVKELREYSDCKFGERTIYRANIIYDGALITNIPVTSKFASDFKKLNISTKSALKHSDFTECSERILYTNNVLKTKYYDTINSIDIPVLK